MPTLVKDYLTFDLRYKNCELERKYSESKFNHQRRFLYIFLLFGFLFGINLNNINDMNNYIGIPLVLRVVLLLFLLLCAITAWNRPSLAEKQVNLLILLYYLDLMETSFMMRVHWSKTMFFLTGINIDFILIFTILAKLSWKATSLFALIINTMNCIRYTDFEVNYENNFYALIQFIKNAAFISASAYLVERNNRESFYMIKNYELFLSQYNESIKKLFPSPVIIAKEQKILFQNKESQDLFDCQTAEEVWEKLGTVKLVPTIQRENNVILISDEIQEKVALFERPNLTLQDVAAAYGKNHKLTQEIFQGEYEKAGTTKTLDVRVTEVYWENNCSLLIIISENLIMEKMNLMREQALNKYRLLTTVSHDYRTPVSGIIGIMNMTLELVADPLIKKYLKIVHRSATSLLLMINDMVDYTHLANTGIVLNKERFSLWDCILEVSDLLKLKSKMKNVTFEKRNLINSNNHNALIVNDKGRIKQVLFNLLENAMKFTYHGSIKITLKEATPQAYEISVVDTGIGIKRENQHNIFNLFGRLQEPEESNGYELGIGLGLPLSQSIVKILNNYKKGGEIKMKSEHNQGSVFSFLLYHDGQIQRNGEENHLEAREAILPEEPKKIFNSPTMEKFNMILIVDSQRSNIESLANHLKSCFEFIYDEAANGEEVLRLIKIRASTSLFYTLILVDCDNNNFVGTQVTNIAKTLISRQEIPFVPVAGLSSGSFLESQNQSHDIGMADTILKPFSKEILKQKLEKYFR